MSMWTYVSGVLEVDVRGRTEFEQEYILNTILSHAPVISGSEQNAKIFVNKLYEIGSTTMYGMNRLIQKDYLNEFDSVPTYAYLITINGSLRDRLYEQTNREVFEFLSFICNTLRVSERNSIIKVSGYGAENVYETFEEFENDDFIDNYSTLMYDWGENGYPDGWKTESEEE